MVGQISRSRQHQLVPARKHHWLRWAVAGVAAVVVLALAGTYAFVHFLGGPAPAPLVLPRLTAAGTGSASADGAWTAGNGSPGGERLAGRVPRPGGFSRAGQ